MILNPEDSNSTVAPYTTRYACPAVQPQSQIFSGLPDFTVSVTCISESIDEDSNSTPVTVFVYRVVAVACNKPVGGSCPNNSAPGGAYVERSVRVLLETCRQTASGASC